jgi:hypothetical protein
MKWPTLNCPFCGGILRNTDLHKGEPLICPVCGAKLQHSTSQLHLSGFIALCVALLVLYLLGLRGIWLVVTTVLVWFPVYVAWDFVFTRIVPPRFEAYVPKDYKGGLFGN